MSKELTQELVRDLFNYNPETGALTNKFDRGTRAKVGEIAGFENKLTGYLVLGINGNKYLVHRVCFLHYYGHLPQMIDHKDNNAMNNEISNLRKCTKKQNAFNSKAPTTNTSGIKGVSLHKETGKWKARIMIDSKAIHVGSFNDIEDAKKAVESARIKHHKGFANHG